MKIHEYQAKEILRAYGVRTPKGIPCFSEAEAEAAARQLGGEVWVVKAQIHAGGRGKGGGVKVVKSIADVKSASSSILGMQLITHQTGPEGQLVKRLLVEEGAQIDKELYVGMVVDRESQSVCLMASSEGGMDIEEVAVSAPEKIHKVFIDSHQGLDRKQAIELNEKIGIPHGSAEKGADYVAFGAFFSTKTKQTTSKVTPDILEIWSTMTTVPCVAIGGITQENCRPLIQAGADFLAVVSAIWDYRAGPGAAVKAFNKIIEQNC